jgi:endonuclease/exonuclease/phosphatase family metal-dependent hydrolase
MAYNLLNYPGSDSAVRNTYYRTIVRNTAPDILVTEEMTSAGAMNGFLEGVMNTGIAPVYSSGTFIDGPDTDNAIFYKTAIFTFISNTPIHTALRDISEFKLVHTLFRDTVRIYAVHLKASSGSSNEVLRAAEVDSLRKFTNSLPAGSYFMVVGDFNIYTADESAYTKLLNQTPPNGAFNDPLTMPGIWNQAQYAPYHTQSPRVRQFGGGATGGMDDRFDLILYSNAVKDTNKSVTYISGSLTPYGNDGNHFNDSINKRPNTAVADSIADALHYASDHLPVFATFRFRNNPLTVTNLSYISPDGYFLYQNYPNPFNPETKIEFNIPSSSKVSLKIYNSLGKEISELVNERLNSGSYSVTFNAGGYNSGIYFYKLTAGSFSKTRKMILVK